MFIMEVHNRSDGCVITAYHEHCPPVRTLSMDQGLLGQAHYSLGVGHNKTITLRWQVIGV